MKKQSLKTNGFTLIEILVAMTIVAILMAISLVSLTGARKVARDGKRKADLEQIRSALEIYRSDCKTYPSSLTFGAGSSLVGAEADCSGNTYLDEVPNDPMTSSYTYTYNRISDNSYALCSYLEADQDTSYTNSECNGVCGDTCYYKVNNY